ncbi:MAG: hypothetical protein WC710_14580 [Gallionella sp.]|jgi:hypothetical protein
MTDQKQNHSDNAPLMVILQITPEILRELFQLPEGAEILDLHIPMSYRGLLEVRVMGAGWPTMEGYSIMRTGGTVQKEYDADGKVVSRIVDWGLPTDGQDTIERLEKLTEWQPIETVPRSGTVLIFVPDNAEGERVLSASFARIEHHKSLAPKFVFYLDECSPGSDPEVYGATRWMPLPDEPIDK